MENRIIQILSEPNPDPVKVALTCTDVVNNLCYKANAVVQEIHNCGNRLVKDRFLQLAVAFIKNLAFFNANRMTDSRNEIACKVADAVMKELSSINSFTDITNWEPDGKSFDVHNWERRHQKTLDFGGKCAFKLQSMHRTLQQQFAATCYCYISCYMTDEQRNRVEVVSGVYGWDECLPLI